MTEYEIADLAASKVFELQGGVSLFQTAISMTTDIVLQYMNILFAYIIAAYFIGANLGRRQVGGINNALCTVPDLVDCNHYWTRLFST